LRSSEFWFEISSWTVAETLLRKGPVPLSVTDAEVQSVKVGPKVVEALTPVLAEVPVDLQKLTLLWES